MSKLFLQEYEMCPQYPFPTFVGFTLSRACKYNESVFGTYFECERVKCTHFSSAKSLVFYRERGLTAGTSSNIYFAYKCEAMFSTQRLKISKCTWIKCLLETTFASSVKPTINLRKNNLNNAYVTKNCHAKNRSPFTFDIIIIKNHEQPRGYMVHLFNCRLLPKNI